MPKNEVEKVNVDKELFLDLLKEGKSSIRKLGREIPDTSEKTIRRQLNAGRMRPALLYNIAEHLNIHPQVLSGNYIFYPALLCVEREEYLKRCYKEYPYSRVELESLKREGIKETLKRILALFDRSYSQFEAMEFEEQYKFQRDLFEAIIRVIISHFKVNALGKNDEMEIERILFELESWRDDHYIYEYAENTLRKKFLDNLPVGCTKSEIERMTPAELIDLDLELQDHGREHDRIRKYDDYDIMN